MKTIIRLSVILSLICIAWNGFAFETGVSFNLGNMDFSPDRKRDADDFSEKNYLWGINLYTKSGFTRDLSMESGFAMDPILKNTSYARLSYVKEYFSLGLGPLFGAYNSLGVTTSAHVELPGVAFATGRYDGTILSRLMSTENFSQDLYQVSAGYYVRNAICSANLESKRFTEHTSEGDIIDLFTEYSFTADMFKKNVPYTVLISFAYQQLDKIFKTGKPAVTHTLGSLIIETELKTKIGRAVETWVNLESCMYAFGLNDMFGFTTDQSKLFFRVTTGLSFNTAELKPDGGLE